MARPAQCYSPFAWAKHGPFRASTCISNSTRTRRASSLERELRAAIDDGRLASGARLPSSRTLASDLGIARNSIADVYAQLTAEGWLEARVGAGTWVSERAVRPVAAPDAAAIPPADAGSTCAGASPTPRPSPGARGSPPRGAPCWTRPPPSSAIRPTTARWRSARRCPTTSAGCAASSRPRSAPSSPAGSASSWDSPAARSRRPVRGGSPSRRSGTRRTARSSVPRASRRSPSPSTRAAR